MRKLSIPILVIALLVCVSCATFVKNSYVTLNESKDLYYTAMGVAADFQAKGIIDQGKRDEINKAAKIFKEAHNLAVDALNVYNKTSLATDRDKFSVALAGAIASWTQVANLINAIKPNTIQSSLIK